MTVAGVPFGYYYTIFAPGSQEISGFFMCCSRFISLKNPRFREDFSGGDGENVRQPLWRRCLCHFPLTFYPLRLYFNLTKYHFVKYAQKWVLSVLLKYQIMQIVNLNQILVYVTLRQDFIKH